MPSIKQVQTRAVRRHATRAVRKRLGYPAGNAVISVERDPDHRSAVVLHVNSGGNALACATGLRYAGYRVEPAWDHPDDAALSTTYGVKMRILPTA